jgi:alpha-mannosidase
MKRIKSLLLFLVAVVSVHAQQAYSPFYEGGERIEVKVTNYYKNRPDHSPGREILVSYFGTNKSSKKSVAVQCAKCSETTKINQDNLKSVSVLLPEGVGVHSTDTILVSLVMGKSQITDKVIVPKMRYWNVYIYPHSHVDIGYTNTQANVELIHKRNLDVAMDLAEKTKDYPEGARYKWNPEVSWAVDRYLQTNDKAHQDRLLEAIRKGYINIDGSYVNTNTTACNDEELFHLYSFSKKIQSMTGRAVRTIVQVDIPGVSWGMIPVANQMGIHNFLLFDNGNDRVGLSKLLDFKPFWWIGPDGKSKVLFLQPGSYAPGAAIKGKDYWPLMAGQTDSSKLLRMVKTDHPRQNFVDVYFDKKLPELEQADYPYDIFPMSWAMADNTPVDVDLPDGVKSWNEEYAYPKLRICSATEMMEAFATRYGDKIPTRSGDFTEYWTDGLGTAAAYTGKAREIKERLIQTETLRSMLSVAPTLSKQYSDAVNEAWRNIIMGTEHTWTYMNPDQHPICDDILKVKFGFFNKAAAMTDSLMNVLTTSIEKENSNTVAVFNTESWTRDGIVRLSKAQSQGYNSVCDESGKEVLSQRLTTGELCFKALQVPAMQMKKYYLSARKSAFKGTLVKGGMLDNGLLKIKLDALSGDINSCVYKGTEFADNKGLSQINSYRYLLGKQVPCESTTAYDSKIRVKENGPLISSLLVTSKADGCNSLEREVIVTAGSPAVEMINIVDKIGTKEKEGIHFGFSFDILESVTHANVPWGSMELEKQQINAANRNWIAFERWLDISNKEKGVTLCSLNACTFESGTMSANVIGSATDSPEWIKKLNPSSTVYSWALNNHWHTNFPLSQSGKITFKYVAHFHLTGFDAMQSNRMGIESIRPLLCVPVDAHFALGNKLQELSNPDVYVSIYKSVDEGKASVIRLSTLSSKDETVTLKWSDRQPRLYYCSNQEEKGEQILGGQVSVPSNGTVTLRAEW